MSSTRVTDSVDLTNIAIQIEGNSVEQPKQQHQGQSLLCSSEILTKVVGSNAIRYIAVATLVGLLVLLLERFLGRSVVPEELRSAFADILSQNVDAVIGGWRSSTPTAKTQ
jgi:hypothetical protein